MHTLTREREADLSYHTSSEEVALIPKRLSMPHENEQWPISSGSRNCRVSISVHHCLRRKLACLPSSTKHDRVSTRRASLYMLPLCAKLMRVSRSSNICLQQLRYVRRGHLCSQALSFFWSGTAFFSFFSLFFRSLFLFGCSLCLFFLACYSSSSSLLLVFLVFLFFVLAAANTSLIKQQEQRIIDRKHFRLFFSFLKKPHLTR